MDLKIQEKSGGKNIFSGPAFLRESRDSISKRLGLKILEEKEIMIEYSKKSRMFLHLGSMQQLLFQFLIGDFDDKIGRKSFVLLDEKTLLGQLVSSSFNLSLSLDSKIKNKDEEVEFLSKYSNRWENILKKEFIDNNIYLGFSSLHYQNEFKKAVAKILSSKELLEKEIKKSRLSSFGKKDFLEKINLSFRIFEKYYRN